MILRIVYGQFSPGTGASAVVAQREQLVQAVRPVTGLESVMIGVRTDAPAGADAPDPERSAVIVSVWRDVEAMRRATGDTPEDRSLVTRLDMPFRSTATHHFELVDRAFGGLPPDGAALLRIATIRARLNEEARLFEILRSRQPRMIDRGLVGSQLARRVIAGGEVEAVFTGLWPDRSTIAEASGGADVTVLPEPGELADWADRMVVHAYDAIEVAPRLPAVSGPPLVLLDGDLRIVDLTATAAAVLGMPAEEMVGSLVAELSVEEPATEAPAWDRLLRDGTVEGETAWQVTDIGTVRLRFVGRRDRPIAGRHALFVRRRLEPPPTLAELDAAVEDGFGSGAGRSDPARQQDAPGARPGASGVPGGG